MSTEQQSQSTADQEAADRHALEVILQTSLRDRQRPEGALPAGTRVRVVKDPSWDGPWKEEFSGTIDDTFPASKINHPRAEQGDLEYSVRFDSPQLDAAGEGPYRKAVIWGRYLRRE